MDEEEANRAVWQWRGQEVTSCAVDVFLSCFLKSERDVKDGGKLFQSIGPLCHRWSWLCEVQVKGGCRLLLLLCLVLCECILATNEFDTHVPTHKLYYKPCQIRTCFVEPLWSTETSPPEVTVEKCFEQWFRASKHLFQVLRCFMRLRFAHHEYKEKTHTHTHTS